MIHFARICAHISFLDSDIELFPAEPAGSSWLATDYTQMIPARLIRVNEMCIRRMREISRISALQIGIGAVRAEPAHIRAPVARAGKLNPKNSTARYPGRSNRRLAAGAERFFVKADARLLLMIITEEQASGGINRRTGR